NSQEAVVECPTGVTGHANVEIKKYQTEFQNDVRILDVSLNAPKLDLRSGEQTTLTTTVRGLADLQEDLTLRLQNQTPNVVQLAGGEDQNVVIHPNDVQGTGVYTTTRTVTGKQPGGFNLTARVQNPSPITIPFQSTEQILTRSNEPTQNTRGPNAGTREEYFLPVGVAELDRQIAQQQWAGPSVPLQNPCCCCCCFWPSLPGGQRGGGPGPGPGPNPPQGPNPISTNVNLGANKFG